MTDQQPTTEITTQPAPEQVAVEVVTAPKPEKKKEGRPTVMTKDVIQKLEDAFVNGFTDRMACLYAGISPASLYNYCTEHPKFLERKELLKESPNLKAQKKLVEDLSTTSGARFWATTRMPEFMPKSKVEHAGEIGLNHDSRDPEVAKLREEFNARLRSTIIARRRANADQFDATDE